MNQVVRRGPIATFFVGLWDVMNFTRKLVLNLIFFGLLLLLLLLFVLAVGSGGVQPLTERTTFVLAPRIHGTPFSSTTMCAYSVAVAGMGPPILARSRLALGDPDDARPLPSRRRGSAPVYRAAGRPRRSDRSR